MDYKPMGAEEYRTLDLDAFNKRKSFVASTILAGDYTDEQGEQLRGEAKLIMSEVERRNEAAELRNAKVIAVSGGAGEVRASTKPKAEANGAFETFDGRDDPLASPEYERAFAAYITRGAAIPAEFHDALLERDAEMRGERNAKVTLTTDAPVAIPTTLQNRIIEKAEDYGQIYAGVTKTNVQGGAEFPVGSFSVDAHWIGETEVSDYQKLGLNDKITFSYYGLECRLAQSILANVTTMAMFQSKFAETATKAMVKAQEQAIVRGDGRGKYTGYLTETRIPATQKLGITDAQARTWAGWHTAVKKFIKSPYADGVFLMNQSTFDEYIDGMTDSNGQPVSRVNYGLADVAPYSFMGKTVVPVPDDILPDFAGLSGSAEYNAAQAFCIFARLSDYVINSNLQMQASRWVDRESNQVKDQLLLIADGKIANPYGTYIVYKKTA